MGLSLYFTLPTWWSLQWCVAQTIIVVLGRIAGVYGTFYFFRIFFKKETINFWELSFITWGGMIRGVIAFALVMKIPYVGGERCKDPQYCYSREQFDLAVTTTLVLVYFTTLVFGTFMKIYQKWALGGKQEHVNIDETMSHYDHLTHPNCSDEKDDPASAPNTDPDAPKGFNESPLYLWFNKYDEETLRPFLIRKYSKQLMEAQEYYQDAVNTNFDDDVVENISDRIGQIKKAKENSSQGSRGLHVEMASTPHPLDINN